MVLVAECAAELLSTLRAAGHLQSAEQAAAAAAAAAADGVADGEQRTASVVGGAPMEIAAAGNGKDVDKNVVGNAAAVNIASSPSRGKANIFFATGGSPGSGSFSVGRSPGGGGRGVYAHHDLSLHPSGFIVHAQ